MLLEEIDGDDIVVRVQATPERATDGARLADEIIAALSKVTEEHAMGQPDATRAHATGERPARDPRTGRGRRAHATASALAALTLDVCRARSGRRPSGG